MKKHSIRSVLPRMNALKGTGADAAALVLGGAGVTILNLGASKLSEGYDKLTKKTAFRLGTRAGLSVGVGLLAGLIGGKRFGVLTGIAGLVATAGHEVYRLAMGPRNGGGLKGLSLGLGVAEDVRRGPTGAPVMPSLDQEIETDIRKTMEWN